MSVETLQGEEIINVSILDENFVLQDEPLNGTDSRRRLEDKIEELKLKRELKEFDFDL